MTPKSILRAKTAFRRCKLSEVNTYYSLLIFLHSRVLPKIAERTTTGVEANKDSPFYDQNQPQHDLEKDALKLPSQYLL